MEITSEQADGRQKMVDKGNADLSPFKALEGADVSVVFAVAARDLCEPSATSTPVTLSTM